MYGVPRLLATGLLAVALTGCGSTVGTMPTPVAPGAAAPPVDNGLGRPTTTAGAAPVTSGAPGAVNAPGPGTGGAAGPSGTRSGGTTRAPALTAGQGTAA